MYFSASSPSWEVILGDLVMWSEAIWCCGLSSCSEGQFSNMCCLLWVFLMLKLEII